MPTPKFVPGAQLIPLTLTAPAFGGLNTEQGATILSKEWATVLNNAVFDDAGRPASRLGWLSQTGEATGELAKRIFEYYKADATSSIIWATDDNIYEDPSTPVSRKGSLTITDGNIKFVNFNDKCVAFGIGAGAIPAVKTSGNFVTITVNSGTAPTGRVGTSAFGRLWGVMADGKTLRYSALLDETRWDTADGGGSYDFSRVWPAGQDTIVAVEELDGDLVVFGTNNTVILTDGAGASLGLNPTVTYVSGTIPGVGAISQFAIARAVGDLWVLTPNGLVGLKREFVQKSTPFTNLSKNVQSTIVANLKAEFDVNDITLINAPQQSMVILNFPTNQIQFVFDTRSPLPDGTYRSTTWGAGLQTLHYVLDDRNIYGSLIDAEGELFIYFGTSDNGVTYFFTYKSGWLDLGEELNVYLKFVKRLTSFVFVEQNVQVTHTVSYDFNTKEYYVIKAARGGRQIEWGLFEWGTNGVYNTEDSTAVAGTDYAEWASDVILKTLDANPGGAGQYIQVGLRLNTGNGQFALQQINLFAKVGRLAS